MNDSHLSFSLNSRPQLGELGEVDTLITILISLVYQTTCLSFGHASTNLLHELLQLVDGDHAVTVHVEQLECLQLETIIKFAFIILKLFHSNNSNLETER